MKPRAWRLANHLTALLLVAMLASFALAGTALLVYRIPETERLARMALQREVDGMAARLALLLQGVGGRLQQAAQLLDQLPASQAEAMLDSAIDGARVTTALYLLGPDGRVQALGLPQALRGRRASLLGRALPGGAPAAVLPQGAASVWPGLHASLATGERSVAVALRDAQGRVLVAEIPPAALVRAVALADAADAAPMWVLDQAGALVVDSGDAGLPAPAAPPAATRLHWNGRDWLSAAADVPALGWRIVGRQPAGLDNQQVQRLLSFNGLALLASLLAGVLMALLWARRMVRPLQATVVRARQALAGALPLAAAPHSTVLEFNQLAQELQAMAVALHARELRWQSIFHAAPLAMAVNDGPSQKLLDVNEAWCRDFGLDRAQSIGRSPAELGLFADLQDQTLVERIRAAGPARTELRMRRSDGQPLQLIVFGPHPVPGTEREEIWAGMDVSPLRAAEDALRALNHALEARVAQRSEALAESNAALARTAEQLHLAQAELVQAEKMAALGALVAGIAHELHTPLGNGLLAIGSLEAELERFAQASQAGLRRADLDRFLAGLEEGCEIAERSLRRAAELVQNFKQVAVDQTSAQRRRFELHEVVRDMVASLRPGLAGTPYTIEVDVPASGLALDSYPGALGQTLGQLVHNAVQHGLKGRPQGRVRITGGRAADGRIWLRVADDGRGMDAAQLDSLFGPPDAAQTGLDPGAPGAGLGLRISADAVAQLLGGTLSARSSAGQGACFELLLPARAPGGPGDTGPWQA